MIRTATRKTSRPNKRDIEAIEITRNLSQEKPKQKPHQPIEVEVQFRLRVGDAKWVSVAGTFNQWDPKRTPLTKEGEDWVGMTVLPRGCYEYRFVVDGRWLTDPTAKESVPNPFGSWNSVLSI